MSHSEIKDGYAWQVIAGVKIFCSNFAKKTVTSMTTLTRPRHDWADRGQGKVGGQGITLTR
ncbi:hypothetical protein BE957_00220 (plasmid) [Escherichia coli]|nr:hypothetical protein BE957_00220 [Escherichia coli]